MLQHSSPRRALSAVVGVIALALVVVSFPGAAQAQDPVPPAVAARRGAAWLVSQSQTLPIDAVPGSPSWGTTLDAAFALVSVGTADDRVQQIWDGAVAQRDAIVSPGGVDSPGALAKMILLALAVGENPTTVGASPGDDLVDRLLSTLQPSGLFGTADATYDGAYRQGLTILALDAAGASVPAAAVTWLVDQQCVGDFDGAWMPNRVDTTEPCAPDPAAFVAPDTNSTSLAISALAKVGGNASSVDAGLDWLASIRLPGGGWENSEGWGMDPNSTAVVMQALVDTGAAGQARFTTAPTPMEALLGFQLGCDASATDRGAFFYMSAGDGPSMLATVQAVPAAAGSGIAITGATQALPDAPDPSCDQTETTTTTTAPTTPTTAPESTPATPGGSGALQPGAGGEGKGVAFVG